MASPPRPTTRYEAQRFELERIAGALALAEAAAVRLRNRLSSGPSDVLAALLESDLSQATEKVSGLRERLVRDSEEVGAAA